MQIENAKTSAAAAFGAADLASFQALKIVELGSWLAAPNACALFADLGAEVLKIETEQGDPLRNFPASMGGGSGKSAAFTLLNRRKKSAVIDVNQDSGKTALDALLSTADVFVTNMRSSTLTKNGLDPETVLARHPRLIYASLTGQGLRGPDKDAPGFDSGAFWARSGMLNQVTAEGAEPLGLLGGYGDLMTSLALFAGVLVALRERDQTGKGGLVEASLLRTGAWVLSGDVVSQASLGRAPRPKARSSVKTPLVNSYRTADGRWFFLTGVETSRHFPSVANAVGRSELLSDSRFADARSIRNNAADLIGILDREFASRPLAEWAERFKQHDVWWEKVATPEEAMKDPQVAANAMAGQIAWGSGAIDVVTSPYRVFERPAGGPAAAPDLGEDTEEVLKGSLASPLEIKVERQ